MRLYDVGRLRAEDIEDVDGEDDDDVDDERDDNDDDDDGDDDVVAINGSDEGETVVCWIARAKTPSFAVDKSWQRIRQIQVGHLVGWLGGVNCIPLAKPLLPNSHQPKQNQIEGGTAKIKVNPTLLSDLYLKHRIRN